MDSSECTKASAHHEYVPGRRPGSGPLPARTASMICQSCEATLPEGFRFCGNCGAAVAARKDQGTSAPGGRPVLADPKEKLALETRLDLAASYALQGMVDLAIQEYEKLRNKHPHFADIRNNLGKMYRRAGKYEAAMREFQEALRLNPNFIDAHVNLGVVYKYKFMLDEAVAHFRKVLETNKSYADVYNHLGEAYVKKGMLREALEAFRQALKVNPSFREAQENYNVAAKKLQESAKR